MRRRKSTIFFLVLGICLIALAAALNIGWIILNWTEFAILILGIIFFAVIITGLILNTIFLLREIRRNEQTDAVLNAVTHELKTPIASIKLYLETLKSRDIDEDKRKEFYDVMLADSERLLSTVEQVLQAGRTREKDRQMNITIVDIVDVVQESADIVSTRAKLPAGTVKISGASGIKVKGDREELLSVFTNLIENAVKYSGSEEPRITVKVRSSMVSRVDVFVKDNGIGIGPQDLKHVFKRFYRVPGDSSVRRKGTGLGLFIAKSIIEKHGGRIFAESKGLGKGSTFIVRLPQA
jgi:signal transduction histidine kinase